MEFSNKCVVVTGASSGMGRQIALDFTKNGATVVAVARRQERLEELAKEAQEFEGKILPYVGDVTKQEVNEGMIDFAVKTCGKLDVLVNNAGIMDQFAPIGDVTNDLWQKVLDINLNGPMFAMRKAINVMLNQENGGNIVNIASIGGTNGCRAGASYTASKHAIIGLTKNTAFMYVDNKIRCNAICPGGVETEVMNSQTNINQLGVSRVMAGLDSHIAPGKPEDIANAVLYLASDKAKFITGSIFTVDGGVSCN